MGVLILKDKIKNHENHNYYTICMLSLYYERLGIALIQFLQDEV